MRAAFRLCLLCKVLKVSRSGYYEWRTTQVRRIEDASLLSFDKAVLDAYRQSRCTYGHRRILRTLQSSHPGASMRNVLQAMKRQDLEGVPAKRKKPYGNPSDAPQSMVAKNRLRRKFTAKKPDRCWVGDITYIWTLEGWIYLAVVIDLFSRRVVGWATSTVPDAALACQALRNALCWRKPRKWRIMFHSDQGCQYTASQFVAFLREHGILQSMSRRGQCWDNAAMESFFGTLKQETGISEWPMENRPAARRAILDWIEGWYNTNRLHSRLGYESPANFENEAA